METATAVVAFWLHREKPRVKAPEPAGGQLLLPGTGWATEYGVVLTPWSNDG